MDRRRLDPAFAEQLRIEPLALPAAARIEIEEDHEIFDRINDRQMLEDQLMAGLIQEVADAVIRQIITILRPQALVDDNQRLAVDLLKQAIKELVLNNLGPFDRLVISK